MNLISLVVGLLLAYTALANTCIPPSTVVSSNSLSSIFDQAVSTIQYQNSLFDYLADPTFDNLKAYLSTQGRYFIPLWCMAGISLVFFSICLIQVCCFNCCKKESCGTKINRKSYRPCFVTCCIYTYIILSLILTSFTIASFVITSDFVKQTDYTICNVNQTFTQLFEGTAAGVTPSWAGADNFYSSALQISTSFENTLSDLTTTFSSAQYQTVVDSNTGSTYANAISAYTCPTTLTSTTVNCPFANFFQCTGGSQTQTPIFSQEFCNLTFTGSTANLILTEQQRNSTTWHDSLVSLNTQILDFGTNPANFSILLTQSQQLQAAITEYKPQLSDSIQTASDTLNSTEIGTYTFLSLFLVMSILSFMAIFLIYCAKRFQCRFLLHAMWVLFGLLTILFFIISGFMMIGTLTAYDGCTAYNELTTNQASLQSISAYNNQLVQTLQTCFFEAALSTSDTVFLNFSAQPTFNKLKNIQTSYTNSYPSDSFSTVTDTIYTQLSNYANNPNIVDFVGATTAQNPQAALDSANLYAANGGSTSCNATDDKLEYNPALCFPRLLDQTAGTPSCILLRSSSAAIVAARQANFITNNCNANFAVYNSNFDALTTYGQNIQSLTSQYEADPSMNTYKSNYFSYYSMVNSFMDNQTKVLFSSYLTPFTNLLDGSQCSFLTTQLNLLVATTCNNNFPYLYVLTVLCICISICFFFLMLFSYYLTVRMEFFEYLQGDFDNYDQFARSDQSIAIQMADISYKKQRLLQETSKQGSPQQYQPQSYDARYDARYQANNQRYNGRIDHQDPRYQRYRQEGQLTPMSTPPPPQRVSPSRK